MMNDFIVKVEKTTRMVDLPKNVIGNDMENLQEKLIFKFTDEFVNGQARLEYKIGITKNYIVLSKENDTYTIPLKNVLTKEGKIEMQLVITKTSETEEIPVFKSNVFYLYCNKSINAVNEAPDGYELWIETANAKLNLIDEALAEVDNLDIDANKVGKITTVEITRKDGTTKSVEINDGENGADGISLEYNWSGTNLGIKREDEQNYQYVNLKGDKGDAGSIKIEIVNELPQIGDEETIYLVPYQEAETGNIYKEYIYINNSWEELGSIPVEVDLSDYYTKSEVNSLIPNELSDLADDSTHRLVTDTEKATWNNKLDSSALTNYVQFTDYPNGATAGVIKTLSTYATSVDGSGRLTAQGKGYQDYTSGSGNMFISKTTLENVIAGKGLVSNTDYATGSKGGTVRSGGFGINVNSTGQMFGVVHSYAQYNSDDNTQVMSKGTLENVITGKGLTTKSYVDGLVGDIATALDLIQGEVI